MAEYIVNRPDEEVMRRILQQNPDNAVGAILHRPGVFHPGGLYL